MLQIHKSPDAHKTGSSKPRREKMTREERIQARVLKNANVPINQLPVEILTIIIILARDPWAERPRSWIFLSQVCKYWRSVVLDNPAPWKTITFNRHISPTFLQEILKRSRGAPLEIIMRYVISTVQFFWDGLAADANRVKTLHMTPAYSHRLPLSKLMSFFPSLEDLIYDKNDITNPTFETFDVYSNVKALQIYIKMSASLTIPKHFPELRWLNLKYQSSTRIKLRPLLEALQSLPNLQVLYLHPSTFADSQTTTTKTTFTFPELKVLVTEQSIPERINAPKLTYLELDKCQTVRAMYRFCGFNFAAITSIRFEIDDQFRFRIIGYDNTDNLPFRPTHFTSIFETIPTFYPNKFQITLDDLETDDRFSVGGSRTSFPLFAACLKKCTKVTEIILHDIQYDNPLPLPSWHKFFSKVLKYATTVRELTVAWNFLLEELCEYLEDGTIFPRLEKLTYRNDGEREYRVSPQTLSDLSPLQTLMEERPGLAIVLQDFPPVEPELLQQVENLGMRLTQETLDSGPDSEDEIECDYEGSERNSENDSDGESESDAGSERSDESRGKGL